MTESFLGHVIVGITFVLFLILLLITDAFWDAMLAPIRSNEEGVYQRSTTNFFNRLVLWPAVPEVEVRGGRSARTAKVRSTYNAIPPSFCLLV